jgi:hypothetical protein
LPAMSRHPVPNRVHAEHQRRHPLAVLHKPA